MATQQVTPAVKLENSPAESLLSAPGDNYQSLFPSATPSDSTPATMNPMEMMTPKSYSDRHDSPMSTIQEDEEDASPSSDKKPTKKRKSWGQVLPEPKTNLPPRKRAKTDDEKEQRRVERVLRNRRAAQSSRERKRLEVEALEQRNKELEELLVKAQKTNLLLAEELNRFRRDSGVVTRTPSALDNLRDNITLSPELFTAQSALNEEQQSALMPNPTVNPASLSPALAPVPDSQKQETSESKEQNKATSPDVTQHPAVSHVSGSAQVVPELADVSVASVNMDSSITNVDSFSLGDSFGLSAAIDTDRYVLESGLLSSPNSSIVDDDYLAGDVASGFTNQADFELFDINDFLHDEANNVASDIMAASDYAAADHSFDHKVFDFETQISSENPIQQPPPGASSHGCDVGGIAVGI